MAQVISLAILAVSIAIFAATNAPAGAAPEALGSAVGSLIFRAFLIFIIIQAVLYYGAKLVRRGHMGHGFRTSRLNYVSLVITIPVLLVWTAQRIPG